jgi:hypothetical protein
MNKKIEKAIQEIDNYLCDDDGIIKDKIEVLSFSQFKSFISVNKRYINDLVRGIEICCDIEYYYNRLVYNEYLLGNIIDYHNAIKLMYAEYCIVLGYMNK